MKLITRTRGVGVKTRLVYMLSSLGDIVDGLINIFTLGYYGGHFGWRAMKLEVSLLEKDMKKIAEKLNG